MLAERILATAATAKAPFFPIHVLGRLRATGMPIRDSRRYAGPGKDAQRLAMLEEHRTRVQAQLEAVHTHLAFIDRKITTDKERLHG
jgi:hypothetical protein